MAKRFPPLHALLILALGGGCDRGAEGPTAAPADSPVDPLAGRYPEEFRAGGVTLPGRLIARGDSLYHGLAGAANCVLCHGPFLSGGSHGTNLRDRAWHHGDGSYEFIVAVTENGVAEAVQSPIPRMPPMGGIPLGREEVEALAAYIYWFSNTRPASEEVTHPGEDEHEHDDGHG